MFPIIQRQMCGVISFSYMSRKFEPKILSGTYLSHLIYSSGFFQPLVLGVGFFGCVTGFLGCCFDLIFFSFGAVGAIKGS